MKYKSCCIYIDLKGPSSNAFFINTLKVEIKIIIERAHKTSKVVMT